MNIMIDGHALDGWDLPILHSKDDVLNTTHSPCKEFTLNRLRSLSSISHCVCNIGIYSSAQRDSVRCDSELSCTYCSYSSYCLISHPSSLVQD